MPKLTILIFKAPIRVIRIGRKRSIYRLKRQMLRVKIALAQEHDETKEMLSIYRKYTRRQASEAEMKIANKQFIDVLKGLGLGVFAILPFAPITIPIVVKVGKMVGVDILPSSFNKTNKSNTKDKNQ